MKPKHLPYGQHWIEEDDVEAVRLFQLAADQGNEVAQFWLGFAYRFGRGVAQDDVEAVRWFRLAADQGDEGAQYELGLAYATGRGVAEDDVEAYMWLNLAAAQGNDEAQEEKSRLEQTMSREEISEAQRMSREWFTSHPPE